MGAGVVSMVSLFGKLALGMLNAGERLINSFRPGLNGKGAVAAGRIISATELLSEQESFEEAVSKGWIQEVREPRNASTLELKLPESDLDIGARGVNRRFFTKLGFDINQPSSTMNNSILGPEFVNLNSVTHLDITIEKVRKLYMPFINMNTQDGEGAEYITKILYEIEDRSNSMDKYTRAYATNVEVVWNNLKLSRTPHDLLRDNLQFFHNDLWGMALNHTNMFRFYNMFMFGEY
ncbi:hypothetical protein J8V57_19445 [Xenorhabdus sp. PB61.4]|uniref:hypothetical protein n=1 Tax=Xenorhabdus sp. PB61.4 TaxID=2788940 RepID=UPI001E57BD00|nr:hypothetical protein [Xenorhabdus sp. PB61.4]MCC8368374.1 hypothetical protein [Xenorhabdus sp. PB61.4]